MRTPQNQMKLFSGSTSKYLWDLSLLQSAADFFERRLKSLECPESLESIPHFSLMKGCEKAAHILCEAAFANEKIVVYGDYDVDGTTACAMLRRAFHELGIPLEVYIPDRAVEGYGLSVLGVEKLAAQGAQLLLTVDNGIAAVAAAQRARELGLRLIITDHHDVPAQLPKADVIVNPKQSDCAFPEPLLSGVGVAFYVLMAFRSQLRQRGWEKAQGLRLVSYLDFVAIGSIADMVPLKGLNHFLSRRGLHTLNAHLQQGTRVGLAALREALKCADAEVWSQEVGFRIGPHLNASGRMGTAMASEELLETENPQRAAELALELTQENAKRRAMEANMLALATERIEALAQLPAALVVMDTSFHAGVAGIVASRLMERWNRPVLVLCLQEGGRVKGSGRSPAWFDLFSALDAMRHRFEAFGGHACACGLTFAQEVHPELVEHLETAVRAASEGLPAKPTFAPDIALSLEDNGLGVVDDLHDLEPFGVGNPRPRFCLQGVTLLEVRRVGKNPDDNHCHLTVQEGSRKGRVVAFRMAHLLEPHKGKKMHLAIDLSDSWWNGERRAEMKLIDFLVLDA